MQLEGQVALVTGGGRGIGRAIALRFAREGADIAIADLNQEWADGTAQEVRALGRRASVFRTDVSDPTQVQAMVTGAVQELGKIDVLVNNAGIAKGQPFLEVTPETWDAHLKSHLYGTFYCSQAAARVMAKNGYGRIVTIASVAGLMGPIDIAPYGAAKAGMMGLTRAMGLELADYGITANAIAPGPIDTELLRTAWSKEAYEERAQHIPVRRLGTVDEVAHTALFLASPDSGYVSGSVIVLDGGSVGAGAYMVEKYRRRKAEKG